MEVDEDNDYRDVSPRQPRKKFKRQQNQLKGAEMAGGRNNDDVKISNELKWFNQTNLYTFSFKESWDDKFDTTPRQFGAHGFCSFFGKDYLHHWNSTQHFQMFRIKNMKMRIHNFTGYTRNFKLTDNSEAVSTQNSPNGFLCFIADTRRHQNGFVNVEFAGPSSSNRVNVDWNGTYPVSVNPEYVPSYGRRSGLTNIRTLREVQISELTHYNDEGPVFPVTMNRTTEDTQPTSSNRNFVPYANLAAEVAPRTTIPVPARVHNRDLVHYMDLTTTKEIVIDYPDSPWMFRGSNYYYTNEDPKAPMTKLVSGDQLIAKMNPLQYYRVLDEGFMSCATWPRMLNPVMHFRKNYITQPDNKGRDKFRSQFVTLSALQHTDMSDTPIPQFFNCTVEMTAEYEFMRDTDVISIADGVNDEANMFTGKNEKPCLPPLTHYMWNADGMKWVELVA